MLPGSLVSSDVSAFTSYILVNGVVRAHQSWSVDRDLPGDLPASVVASSGITQATGNIVWAEGPDVQVRAVTPWNHGSGWLPTVGDRVEIWAGDGVTYWQQFTGTIDETTGDVGGSAKSSIIDDFDKLNASFSHEPLQRLMPPRERAAADYRAVGLTHIYYVDRALRKAGFFATPPTESRTILSVPAQSSMWPEVGVMTGGVVGGADGGAWCSTYNGPSGVSIGDVQNTYAPVLAYPMTEVVRFSMTVAADHNGNTTMKAYYGATDYVELAVAGSRTVIARLNGVDVCSLVMGSATRVSLLVKAGVWTLRTNNNTTATGSIANPTSAVLDRVTVTADVNSRVSGFHAVHTSSSTETLYTAHTPTARYRLENVSHLGLMDAGPAIETTTCKDVLSTISDAVLAGMWIDEAGVFQWAPSVGLRAQTPVQTVTTLDDVLAVGWSDSLLGVRSKVEASYDLPGISRSRWDNIVWYEGGTQTLESGQTQTEFINPPTDTDWVGLSQDYLILGNPGSAAPSNSGHGSVTGGQLADATTEADGSAYLTSSLEKINATTYKLVHSAGSLPSGKKLELRYPSTSSTIWPRWLKQSLPIIRGFAKTQWAKQTLTSATAGPSYAPVLAHDCGPWLSRDADTTVAQRVVDYLATQTAKPSPVITGLQVTYDPRRQLGDVITLSSPDFMGVTLTVLIVSISNSADGSYTQTLGVRIVSAATTFTSYEAFNAAGGELTYEQWNLLAPTTLTYSQFDAQSSEVA